MADHTAIIDRYIAAWNATDPADRRRLVAATFASDATYIDPLMAGDGHDGIDVMIGNVQGQFPDHVFRLTAGPDAVANRLRFSWEMGPRGGETLIGGTDFATVDDTGRLREITGFIDRIPDAPGPAD